MKSLNKIKLMKVYDEILSVSGEAFEMLHNSNQKDIPNREIVETKVRYARKIWIMWKRVIVKIIEGRANEETLKMFQILGYSIEDYACPFINNYKGRKH